MSTTYTENYQLGMQENHNDKFSMTVITENAKIIDGLLKAHEKHIVGFIDGDSRKNLLPVNSTSFTATSSTKWYEIQLQQPIPKGKYVLSFGSISSTDTDSTTCRIMFFSANWADTLTDIQAERGENLTQEITLAKDCAIIRFCAASTATGGVDDTLTFTDAMICEKAIYDITAKYVPYSPTYQELVARVTALEAASTTTASTVSEEATV